MIYLIFLDIDGTILSSEGKIHERTIEAIRKAQEAGNKVFINTGRSDGIIPPWLLEKVHPDGVVAGLGAFIRIGNEILLADVLNREMLSFAMDIADECNDTLIIEGENDSASYNGVCYLGEEHIICEYTRFKAHLCSQTSGGSSGEARYSFCRFQSSDIRRSRT